MKRDIEKCGACQHGYIGCVFADGNPMNLKSDNLDFKAVCEHPDFDGKDDGKDKCESFEVRRLEVRENPDGSATLLL